MPISCRRAIAQHYLSLLPQHPRPAAVQLTATHFGQAVETVDEVVTAAAVTDYLHAIGLDDALVSEVLRGAAQRHGMSAEALRTAVEQHFETVEA